MYFLIYAYRHLIGAWYVLLPLFVIRTLKVFLPIKRSNAYRINPLKRALDKILLWYRRHLKVTILSCGFHKRRNE